MRRCFILLLVAVGLVLPPPAHAAPLVREHYSGTDSFDFDDCGFVIHNEVSFAGVFMLKAPRAEGAPPRYFDNYEVHEVLSANGRTLTLDHQGLFKDLHVTLVEGTVYQYVGMEAGQPFVMRDEDGQVILRDRGVLKTTFQFDTQGDTDPDNDVFVEGSFSVLADNGRHPGFYIDSCQVLEDYFVG